MQANNLSICIPYKGCNKNCNYCVSKMTGYIKNEPYLSIMRNLNKVKKMAEIAQVTSVSITSKGEPLLNLMDTKIMIDEFRNYPVELQTNGILLREDPKIIESLYASGLDIIAISIDSADEMKSMPFKAIKNEGMTTRATLCVTNMIRDPKEFGILQWINLCKECNVDQFSLRKVTEVNPSANPSVNAWIRKNTDKNYYDQLYDQARRIIEERKLKPIRHLPYNVNIYDFDGTAFTMFDYCIQDSNDDMNIRSLIWQEDGHLYTSWNSLASRIF